MIHGMKHFRENPIFYFGTLKEMMYVYMEMGDTNL